MHHRSGKMFPFFNVSCYCGVVDTEASRKGKMLIIINVCERLKTKLIFLLQNKTKQNILYEKTIQRGFIEEKFHAKPKKNHNPEKYNFCRHPAGSILAPQFFLCGFCTYSPAPKPRKPPLTCVHSISLLVCLFSLVIFSFFFF